MNDKELGLLLETCLNETVKENSIHILKLLNDPEYKDENYETIRKVVDSNIMSGILRKNMEISIISTLKVLKSMGVI